MSTVHSSRKSPPAPVITHSRPAAGTLQTCTPDSHKKEYVEQGLGNPPKRDARGPRSGNSARLAALLEARHQIPKRGPWKHAILGPRITREEKFWLFVRKGGNCWVWTGSKDQYGYGQFGFSNHCFHAHRVAYAFAYGVPPDGYCICHSCDNRACVRPDHLFAATQGDNLRDMVRKGRHAEQTHRQTHCKRGHEYTPENTHSKPDGTRSCKACMRVRQSA